MKVYFISGLAADRSVFKRIELPPHCEAVHLDWIRPEKGETLSQYSLRLAERIDTSEPFALLGLSMGGMIATELSRHLQPAVTILISSISCSVQLPPYFKLAAFLRLQKIVPIGFIQKAAMIKRIFTRETLEDKTLLRGMIRSSDPYFIRWSMDAILKWQCTVVPKNLVHIHGTRDEVLPLRFTRPTHIIRGGGHLMVFNRAAEINKILGEVLSSEF